MRHRLFGGHARHVGAAEFAERQLEAGKGRDETLPTARRIGMFIRDARVDAYGWTPSEGLETKVDAARATLGELATLYGATLEDVFRKTPGVGADQ